MPHGMMMERMGGAKRRGQQKAIVSVDAHVGGVMMGDHKYHMEEMKRVEAEVKALESELSPFDPKAAAVKVKQSLELELRRKKLRLEECKIRCEQEDDDEEDD